MAKIKSNSTRIIRLVSLALFISGTVNGSDSGVLEFHSVAKQKTPESTACTRDTHNGVTSEVCITNKEISDVSTQNTAPNTNGFPIETAKRIGAATGVLAIYTLMGTWSYFAWYSKQDQQNFQFKDEGWFGPETYAGGTDKIGHFFSNYIMARGFSSMLRSAGMSPLSSSLTANALTLIFFTGIEVKDGLHKNYGFSMGDMISNVLGNVLATVMVEFPKVDEMFDLRLEYFPSKRYREALEKQNDVNAGEDYTGMFFTLWYHLSSLNTIKESGNPLIKSLKYLDVGLGYHTDNFKPEPVDSTSQQSQQLYFGITANVQKIFDDLFFDQGKKHNFARGITSSFNEFFTIPGTALHLGPKFYSQQNQEN